jgi:DNA-binding NarL/FixJ family response regulator
LEVQRALGLAALFERDLTRARAQLLGVWTHTCSAHIDDPGAFPAVGDLIEALLASDRFDEAGVVIDQLSERVREQDHPWGQTTLSRARAYLALATTADYDASAADELAAAAATYGLLGLDFDHARTLLSLGIIQRRFKKRGAARSSLAQAAELFDLWGSAGWAALSRAELERVSGRRSAPDATLTPAETRVAELAAQGLSNKDIAGELFVSVNTVEGHLSRAYSKLGVRSRAKLATRLGTPDSR